MLMACGSAPISPTVMDFLRIALLCDILEGLLLHIFKCLDGLLTIRL